MNAQDKVDAINSHSIGTNVTYWPILYKSGKRTKIRSKAYVDAAGQPVIFVEGVSGCVHIDHVQVGAALIDTDSPLYHKDFCHRW